MRKLKNSELERLGVEEFKKTEKIPLIVVLDNIRSLNNIGSVFRTADAFLVERIYLCGITATPPHKEIHKTALGATDSVDWTYAESTEELVRELKSQPPPSKPLLNPSHTSIAQPSLTEVIWEKNIRLTRARPGLGWLTFFNLSLLTVLSERLRKTAPQSKVEARLSVCPSS